MGHFKYVTAFITVMMAIQSLCDSVEAQGDVMVSCRSTISCNATGEDEIGIVSARECCVETPGGLSYTIPHQTGDQTCTICIVFGFFQDSYTGTEQSSNHVVQVGYQKGAIYANQTLLFNVYDSPGSAKKSDYIITTQHVRALYRTPDTPDDVVLSFNVDNIAQEMNETLTLGLTPAERTALPTGDGVFFRNNITIIIVDSDTVEVSFTEGDYRANERDTSMHVKVVKNALIATAISLEVIPLTIQQSMDMDSSLLRNISGIPRSPPIQEFLYSPPFADVADFNNASITITFDPDEDQRHNELTVPVPIFDDSVDEANEQIFVVKLQPVSGGNVNSITIRRQVSLCRIIDDDIIRIGFEQPFYTYMEPVFEEVINQYFVPSSGSPVPVNGPVYLAKEDNVASEQTFSVSVQLAEGVVPSGKNIQPATLNDDYRLNVDHTHVTLQFLPEYQRLNVQFTLFPDNISEGTEAFSITSAPETTLPTYYNPIHLSTDTFVIIKEFDGTTTMSVTTDVANMTNDVTSTPTSDSTTDIEHNTTVCSVFTKELEIILHLTNESQKLNNISMVIKRLAEVITDVKVSSCAVDQIRVHLDIISDILSSVAQFIQNRLNNETFDSTIVSGSTQIVNSLLQWPTAAIEAEASARLIRSYEIISSVYTHQLAVNDAQNFTFPYVTLVTQLSTTDDLQGSGRIFTIGESDITKFTVTDGTPRAISSSKATSLSTSMNSSIFLPGSVFRSSTNTTGLVFTLYKASTLFPVSERTKSSKNSSMTEVGTHVIAANINGQDIEGLKDPVIITLQLNIREGVFLMPGSETCVSWDFGLRDWTDRGCKTSAGQNRTITCSCSHLTNFAVLMDVCLRQEDCKPVNKHVDTVLSFVSYIGIAISIIGLLLTIITMLAFKKVRQRETSKYHIQLCIALLLMLAMSLVLVATSEQALDLLYGGCVFISVFVHYFALVAVMWMGAEALLMLQKVVIIFVRITTKYIVITSLVCWLAPIVPVLISLIVDLATGNDTGNDIIVKRTGDNSFCFLSHAGAFWGAFLGPILLIIIFNIIAFVCVIFVLLRQVRRRSKAITANKETQKMGYKKIIFLMIRISGVMALFGLTWLFAILTVVSVTGLQETFQILFTIFNSFQGCFIFIFLCVLDQKVRESWKCIYIKMKSRFQAKKPSKKYPCSDLELATNGTGMHSRCNSFNSSRQATMMSTINPSEAVSTDSTLT